MKNVFIWAVIAILAVGCSWEDEETLFPDSFHCDTLDVSFSVEVVPIMQNNCFACHSNANAPDFASGLSLEDYEDISSASDRIIGAINHNDGYIPMPKGMEKMDSCQINILEAWVNQGSLNN